MNLHRAGRVGAVLALPAVLALALPATALPATALPAAALPAAALPAATAARSAARAGSSATTTAAAATLPVQVSLGQLSPAAVTPRDELVVAGQVRNVRSGRLGPIRIELRLHAGVLSSRDAVQSWTDEGQLETADRRLGDPITLPSVPHGARLPFSFTIPAGRLQLPRAASGFGPRGIAVQVLDHDGQQIGFLRTTLIWYPGKEFSPTPLTLLAPVTGPASADAGAVGAASAASMAPGGRLRRVVEATMDPAVGWALDPALLAAASANGDRDWLADVLANRSGRDLVGLPYADPDLAALTHHHGAAMLTAADQLGREVSQQVLGTPMDTTVAWPAGGAADAGTLTALARAGRTTVLLSADRQPARSPTSYTLNGRSRIATAAGGSLQGLLYDEQISGLLAGTGGPDPLASRQSLLSQLAAITLERPGDPRAVLAVLPRDWNPNPGPVQAAITALHSAPWITISNLATLRAVQPDGDRQPPDYTAAGQAELPASAVVAVANLGHTLSTFGPALEDPAPVIDPLREQLISLLSTAWRTDLGGLANARTPVSTRVSTLANGIRIVHGGRITFTATQAPLPVVLANTLPYPVRVVVQLRPRSGRLVAEKQVPVTLAPHSQRRVLVPTRAIASGDVDVVATLHTLAGTPVGNVRVLRVRIRRDWETRGIIGIGGLLTLLLVGGLLRGARRNRPRVPPEAVPDVDDLASAARDAGVAR